MTWVPPVGILASRSSCGAFCPKTDMAARKETPKIAMRLNNFMLHPQVEFGKLCSGTISDRFIRLSRTGWLWKRYPWSRHNAGHAQDLLILDIGNRRNQQAHILQQFHFFQRRVGAHLGESHLARQPVKRAQVRDIIFAFRIIGIRVRIARHFGDGIQRTLRSRVVTEHPVTLADLFQSSDGILLAIRAVPHLLALHEECVPVVVVRVCAEDPVVSLGSRKRHRIYELAESALYTGPKEKRNKM